MFQFDKETFFVLHVRVIYFRNWPVLKRVQISYIFTGNIRSLCLSCNVKRTANACWMVTSITSTLIMMSFLSVTLHEKLNRGQ